MLTAFEDCQGLIYTEFNTDASKTRTTIIKETYFYTVLHVQNAIKEWRHGVLLQTVFLLQDKAGPHHIV